MHSKPLFEHAVALAWEKINQSVSLQDESKPIVYVQSLLHAREWLSQAATLYAIEKLVVNPEEHNLVSDVDWIIMPVANPDGFVYSTFTVSMLCVIYFVVPLNRFNCG